MRATSSADPAAAFRLFSEGVLAAVRVQPRSRPEELEGFAADAAGAVRLKARLGAAPEGGKADAALLKLLARAWGVAPSRLTVAAGGKERNKTVLVTGEPAELMHRLRSWADGEKR